MRTIKTVILLIFCLCAISQAMGRELPRHRAYQWSGLSLEDLSGDICIPVLFINFTESNNDNEIAVSESSRNLWMSRLNEKSTSNHMGENGSVNDYFRAQSYGRLNVTFENIGSYTASGKASDYAENDASSKMLRQAVQSLTEVDWSRYDCNGDKEVDCLLAIYAGHCDDDFSSRRALISSIYPHQNWMSNVGRGKEKVSGDYYIQSYVLANNLRHSSTSLAAISTICHELSHGIFDLPDYYKSLTSYLGQYDAMCYGYRQMTYGAATDHCCDYTSFNRMYLGWLNPRELTDSRHVRLNPLSLADEAYIIFDPADNNHFFLLENRAKIDTTWDAHLPAGGLIVVEVNWQQDAFDYHNVNAGTKKNIRVINATTGKGLAVANDSYMNFDQSQIPFGINGRNAIPSSVHSTFTTKTVTNITINADLSIEFDFMAQGSGIQEVPSEEAHSCFDLYGHPIEKPATGCCIERGSVKYILH